MALDWMPKFLAGTGPLSWQFDKSIPGPFQWKIRFGPEIMDWADVRLFYIPEEESNRFNGRHGWFTDCLARLTYLREINTSYAYVERQYSFNGSYGHERFFRRFPSAVRQARRYIEKTSSIIAYITRRIVVIPPIESQLPHRRERVIVLTDLGKKMLAEVQAEKAGMGTA